MAFLLSYDCVQSAGDGQQPFPTTDLPGPAAGRVGSRDVPGQIVRLAAKPKHIGIVACSAEGAALCFREIAAYSLKLMGEHMHPQVTLSCIALGEWMPAFNRGDYEGVAEFMLRETEIVAKAGAQLAICPDNSAHLAFKHVAARSPIPWLHIAEEVAKAAVRGGYRHAALLGTRFTMTGPVYPEVFEKYALKIDSPAEGDQKIVDDIIFRELVNGIVSEASPASL